MKKLFLSMDRGILTTSDMKLKRYKILYGVMFGILSIYCLSCLIPVVWILLSGFKDVKELYSIPATFFPKQIDLSKLGRIWREMEFQSSYINTLIMAVGAVAADIVITGLAGYVLSRLKPVGTKLFFTVCFWTMLLPATMRTVPLYMVMKDLPIFHISLLDTYWPIWIIAAANAFNIILFKNFFDGVPMGVVEAAKIDGASNLRIFFRIMIPLSVPAIMTVGILSFNGQLGQFFWPYLFITDKNMTVIGVKVYQMKSSNFTMDYQMLAIIFTCLPQMLIFAVFSKYIIGGLNAGAVKG